MISFEWCLELKILIISFKVDLQPYSFHCALHLWMKIYRKKTGSRIGAELGKSPKKYHQDLLKQRPGWITPRLQIEWPILGRVEMTPRESVNFVCPRNSGAGDFRPLGGQDGMRATMRWSMAWQWGGGSWVDGGAGVYWPNCAGGGPGFAFVWCHKRLWGTRLNSQRWMGRWTRFEIVFVHF